MKQSCFIQRVLLYFGMIGVESGSTDKTTRNFVFLSNCVQQFFWRSHLALCIIKVNLLNPDHRKIIYITIRD